MSSFPVTPILQTGVYVPLAAFIVTVTGLPSENVIQGLGNRASMPTPGFIVFQAISRKRLKTNEHSIPAGGSPATAGLLESVELQIQIDCYGPQSTDEIEGAEDWATILSSTLRDEYGVDTLAPTLTPLYADEARMIPLVAGEDQYEERWSVDAHFEYDPTTTIPQQYAAALAIELLNIQEQFPA